MLHERSAIEGELDRAPGPAPPRLPHHTSQDAPPRRLEDAGPRALSLRELIALILAPGRGHERAARAADALTTYFLAPDGHLRLRSLARADVAEVARVGRIGRPAAARLIAGLELGLRAAQEGICDRDRMVTARDVYERMRFRVRDLPHEEFWVLVLNAQHQVLREVCVSRGMLDETLIHPREVFRMAILESASALVLVHNHPSGEPAPSSQDDMATAGLISAGHTLGICIIDHIIIGDGRYYSYNEARRLPPAPFHSFAWGKEARLLVDPPRRTRKPRKSGRATRREPKTVTPSSGVADGAEHG